MAALQQHQFQLLTFKPDDPNSEALLEAVSRRLGMSAPLALEPDASVTILGPGQDMDDARDRVAKVFDAAAKELDLDWHEYFRFANVPG